MSEKRVTISDIARESGASPTTVSLVLRDKGGIGMDTRERVLAAAQTLGYERKHARRSSESDVTTAALLFRANSPSPTGGSPGVNPFYSWVLTGVEAVARGKRISLLYGTVAINESNEILEIPHHLLGEGTDGIIVVGAFEDDAVMALAGKTTRPVVLVDGPGSSPRFDVVASDNVQGTRTITNHLVEAGHTRIALLSRLAEANPNFTARESGYRLALTDHGLSPVVGRIEQWNVSDALDRIFEESPDVTAIVCVNDQFALDAGNELERRGLRMPDDISLVGFDNTDHATALRPGLTTMSVDKVGMGRLAITLLDYRLRWPDSAPASVMLTPSLTIRGSVASPNPDRHQIIASSPVTESFR